MDQFGTQHAENPQDLRPRDIRYTQDSIRDRFLDNKPVELTFRKLLRGELRADDLPWIEVVKDQGHWWVIEGHRRLFLFKKLEELGKLDTVRATVRHLTDPKAKEDYDSKKTTKTDGETLVCRRGKLEDKIRSIINEYKREDQEFTCFIEEGSAESLDADDYMDYNGPDFAPGGCRRKNKKLHL